MSRTPQGGAALAKRECLSLRFSREGRERVTVLSCSSRAVRRQKGLLGSPYPQSTGVRRVAGGRGRLGELLPGLSDGSRNTRPLTDSLSGRCPRAAGGPSPAALPSCPQTWLPCCTHHPCMPPPRQPAPFTYPQWRHAEPRQKASGTCRKQPDLRDWESHR